MRLFNIDGIWKKWYDKGCLILAKLGNDRLGISAAAIAYFTFFSLIPLLLVFMWLFSLWGADSLKEIIMHGIPKLVPVSGEFLEHLLEEAMSIKTWGFLGIIPLAWTGTSLFYLVEQMVNSVWGFPSKGIWKGRLWGTAIVFAFLLFAVFQPVLLYISRLFNLFEKMLGIQGNSLMVWILSGIDRWLLMFVVYSVIYYLAPTRRIRVKYAVASAAVATLGTILLEWIFVTYITMGRIFQLYRVIADVMFLLFWFYLMGYIILIGTEVGYFLYHIDRGDLWDELNKFSDRCRIKRGTGGEDVFQETSGVSSEES
jgi:membrane protein